MIGDDVPSRDLAALVAPQAGRLVATGDRYEPYRLVDGDGVAVAAATAYFRDLLAAGRAESPVQRHLYQPSSAAALMYRAAIWPFNPSHGLSRAVVWYREDQMRLSGRIVLEEVLGPIRKTQAGQILLQLYRARRDPKFASLLRHGTREERFNYIYEAQSWGPGGESRSGYGSSLRATSTLRQQLSRLLTELEITSIFDAGCGDFNWMKEVPYSGTYIGADIVPSLIDRLNDEYGNESHRFVSMDITEQRPPTVDLIICRRVLFHYPDADVAAALRNFRASGSRWLLATTDPYARRNWDIEVGGQRRLNLERPPFSLPRPQRYLIEGWRSDGECMSLYRLERLPNV